MKITYLDDTVNSDDHGYITIAIDIAMALMTNRMGESFGIQKVNRMIDSYDLTIQLSKLDHTEELLNTSWGDISDNRYIILDKYGCSSVFYKSLNLDVPTYELYRLSGDNWSIYFQFEGSYLYNQWRLQSKSMSIQLFNIVFCGDFDELSHTMLVYKLNGIFDN